MELRVGGKYRLSRKLGCGAFGDIYHGKNYCRRAQMIVHETDFLTSFCLLKGTNIRTNEEVAIKLVRIDHNLIIIFSQLAAL